MDQCPNDLPFPWEWSCSWYWLLPLATRSGRSHHSNQNHRFVHGFAHAGFGYLRDDWLANTADPTPLFSLLVQATCRWGVPALFYVWYVAIMYVYVHSLSRIARTFLGPNWPQLQFLLFSALFILLHSLWLDEPGSAVTGQQRRQFLSRGGRPARRPRTDVPAQCRGRVSDPLGGSLPCREALRSRVRILPGSDAAFDLPAECGGLDPCLSVSALVLERRHRVAATVALLFAADGAPVVIYNAVTFGPSSAETFAAANAIMAHWRFPHHTELMRWLNVSAGLKLMLIILAIAWTGDRPLGHILAVSLVASLALTLLQDALDSDALALLFPWRTSVWLVPLATSLLLARGVELLFRASVWARPLARRAVTAAAVIVLADECCVWGPADGSVARDACEGGRRLRVRAQRSSKGDKCGSSPSTWNTFRLRTGAPILVDYKSHPYKDVEVLEWKRRMDAAMACYADLEANGHTAIEELRNRYGITHVVSEQPLGAAAGELVYNDPSFWVYRVR